MDTTMFAVGHIALGYIAGRMLGRAIGRNQNIPLLFTLALLPDIDLLVPALQHRGPTHSIIIATLCFIPFLITWPRKSAPYFAALTTHSLLGDYITTGGSQVLWPISTDWFEYQNALYMGGTLETATELALFSTLIITLIASRDYRHLINTDRRNNLLFVPICTIALPAMFRYPLSIPRALIIPHLALLGIITLSFAITLKQTLYPKR